MLLAGIAAAADLEVPACWVPPVVMFSAGHGTADNDGNLGVHAQREADVVLELTLDLVDRLGSHVVPVLSRAAGERPTYDERLTRLSASQAVAFVEIHTDARAGGAVWADSPWGEVVRNDTAPGFSVLFDDRNALAPQATSLARALARAMRDAGLQPYTLGYAEKYDGDEVPGVYRDRRGLKMLRLATAPAVLIETHHALDFDESLAWRTAEVRQTFARAVLAGLVAHIGCPP